VPLTRVYIHKSNFLIVYFATSVVANDIINVITVQRVSDRETERERERERERDRERPRQSKIINKLASKVNTECVDHILLYGFEFRFHRGRHFLLLYIPRSSLKSQKSSWFVAAFGGKFLLSVTMCERFTNATIIFY